MNLKTRILFFFIFTSTVIFWPVLGVKIAVLTEGPNLFSPDYGIFYGRIVALTSATILVAYFSILVCKSLKKYEGHYTYSCLYFYFMLLTSFFISRILISTSLIHNIDKFELLGVVFVLAFISIQLGGRYKDIGNS